MSRIFICETEQERVAAEAAEILRRVFPDLLKGNNTKIKSIIDLEDLAEDKADLLVLTPKGVNLCQGPFSTVPCGCLLAPGSILTDNLTVIPDRIVLYGMSPRDSLTLSSIDSRSALITLQREIITLGGTALDRQEIPVHGAFSASPDHLLAVFGTLLLMGVSPGALSSAE